MTWPESFFYSVVAIVGAPIWLTLLVLALCLAISTPVWIAYGFLCGLVAVKKWWKKH